MRNRGMKPRLAVDAARVEPIVKCVVCLQIMDKRDSANVSIYKLIQRPENA
jgi:hypothetical protein